MANEKIAIGKSFDLVLTMPVSTVDRNSRRNAYVFQAKRSPGDWSIRSAALRCFSKQLARAIFRTYDGDWFTRPANNEISRGSRWENICGGQGGQARGQHVSLIMLTAAARNPNCTMHSPRPRGQHPRHAPVWTWNAGTCSIISPSREGACEKVADTPSY